MLEGVERLVCLTDSQASALTGRTLREIENAVARCDVDALNASDGHFAAVRREGKTVRMARTIGLPLRYLVAKMYHGPFLIVGQRLDQLFAWCQEQRIGWQFDPAYTRMVPAHYLVEIDQIDHFPFDRCTRIARYEATPRVNWKVAIDAFQEAFHAIMVHRASLPNSAAAPQNPSAALTSARFHGPHRSLSAWANPNYRPPEVGMIVGKYGPTFATAKDQFPGINPNADDNWWFDINVFFPNFFCDTGPGWYFTYNFWPISENRTRWTMDIYQLRAEHAGGLLAQEHTKILLRDAVLEDFSTLEATQQMMESGALTHITISELEIALRHQMHVINQWVAA